MTDRIVSDSCSPEQLSNLDAVFECCRIGNTCEWHTGLSRFALGYNQAYNKSYRLAACLDAQNRTRKEPITPKQPEVLLKAAGEPCIVIERKSIMTTDYARSHGNFHFLVDHFGHLLGHHFPDSMYNLEVIAPAIGKQGKHEIRNIAHQISSAVVSGRQLVVQNSGIWGVDPIPWHFYEELPEGFTGSTSIRAGINTIVRTGPIATVPDMQLIKAGYVAALKKEVGKAAKQFEQYGHCQKLLLLEFYGDYPIGPDIVDIIKEAPIPNVVDQVWLAYKEWVSGIDYETCWLRVRF